MHIGFAGTPAFAAAALGAILDAGLAVTLVLTRPDRPRGRGMKVEPGPVKALACARAASRCCSRRALGTATRARSSPPCRWMCSSSPRTG